MRALKFITGHVIYNPAYTYKFQLKTTIDILQSVKTGGNLKPTTYRGMKLGMSLLTHLRQI